MQKSIIDELCYAFSEESFGSSEEYKEMKEVEKECYKDLCKSINEEIRSFRRGFKLGVRLILESISGDKDISDLLK